MTRNICYRDGNLAKEPQDELVFFMCDEIYEVIFHQNTFYRNAYLNLYLWRRRAEPFVGLCRPRKTAREGG